jgi:hypothetical protein
MLKPKNCTHFHLSSSFFVINQLAEFHFYYYEQLLLFCNIIYISLKLLILLTPRFGEPAVMIYQLIKYLCFSKSVTSQLRQLHNLKPYRNKLLLYSRSNNISMFLILRGMSFELIISTNSHLCFKINLVYEPGV